MIQALRLENQRLEAQLDARTTECGQLRATLGQKEQVIADRGAIVDRLQAQLDSLTTQVTDGTVEVTRLNVHIKNL